MDKEESKNRLCRINELRRFTKSLLQRDPFNIEGHTTMYGYLLIDWTLYSSQAFQQLPDSLSTGAKRC